jgi:hypothetical protein
MGGIRTGNSRLGTYTAPLSGMAAVAAWAMLAGSASAALPAAASLCGDGDTVLFTCQVGKKLVSVCDGGGKATYYFGKPGHVEMSSTALTVANRGFSGGGETQISVHNNAYVYIVYDKTARTSFSSDGHNDPDFTSGLVVQKNGKTLSALECGADATIAEKASHVIQAGPFIEH